MNIKTLMYLVALADEGHFGRAALACHITQPTLSIQLKKMEEYLGVQLIDRTDKNIRLTSKGIEVTSLARGILALNQIIKDVSSTKQPNR